MEARNIKFPEKWKLALVYTTVSYLTVIVVCTILFLITSFCQWHWCSLDWWTMSFWQSVRIIVAIYISLTLIIRLCLEIEL